jgi:hypothetical protein
MVDENSPHLIGGGRIKIPTVLQLTEPAIRQDSAKKLVHDIRRFERAVALFAPKSSANCTELVVHEGAQVVCSR